MLKHVNNQNFREEVLKAQGIVLVDFFATWCGPCKMLSPVLEKISNSRAEFDIAKVDIDNDQDLAIEYGIEVVPTMLIFKGGEVVDRIEGYLDENTIVNKVISHM